MSNVLALSKTDHARRCPGKSRLGDWEGVTVAPQEVFHAAFFGLKIMHSIVESAFEIKGF